MHSLPVWALQTLQSAGVDVHRQFARLRSVMEPGGCGVYPLIHRQGRDADGASDRQMPSDLGRCSC